MEEGNEDVARTVEAHNGHHPQNIELTERRGTRPITTPQATNPLFLAHLHTWPTPHLEYPHQDGSLTVKPLCISAN
jgi:hypothetical protein